MSGMEKFQTYSFPELEPGVETQDFPLPVRIIGTGRERITEPSYRWNNLRHRHRPFHVLQYTTAGHGVFRWGRDGGWKEARVLGPGDLFVASWNFEFEYLHPGNGEPWEFRWIIVEGTLADQALARVCRLGPVVFLDPGSAPILLLENLHRRLELRDSWDRWALSTVAYEWCLCLVNHAGSANLSTADEVSRLASGWVLAHLADADCPSMAAWFGYNDKYFAEFLRRHTGLTPQRFILDRKLRYASVLLASTARTVGAISSELGFAEDNYFSKVFRRHSGQTPQEYRRRHQESLVFDELVPL